MGTSGRTITKSTSVSGEVYKLEHNDGSQSDTAVGTVGTGGKKRRSSLSAKVVAMVSRRSRSTSQLSQTGEWHMLNKHPNQFMCGQSRKIHFLMEITWYYQAWYSVFTRDIKSKLWWFFFFFLPSSVEGWFERGLVIVSLGFWWTHNNSNDFQEIHVLEGKLALPPFFKFKKSLKNRLSGY